MSCTHFLYALLQLTPEEELKLEIRKQRNRRSANESRIRRKRKLEALSEVYGPHVTLLSLLPSK